jgi:hypothetical protein
MFHNDCKNAWNDTILQEIITRIHEGSKHLLTSSLIPIDLIWITLIFNWKKCHKVAKIQNMCLWFCNGLWFPRYVLLQCVGWPEKCQPLETQYQH